MATPTLWPDWGHLTWRGPQVKPTLPPSSFFRFPPSPQPAILPPPPDHPTLAHPFTIPIDWYNAALSPNVPITFALTYATVITVLNSVNKQRKYKPWAISKTRLFKYGVLAHNAFLSAYSLWTFIGMGNGLLSSIVDPRGPYGLAGTIDSMCKLHGPRGYGSAAVYDPNTDAWAIANRQYHLAKDTLLPEASDVGRMWNEGLAFYGWIFYISKFYEVIDTLIIIAKGKKSSFLQTYHHAGAMMCMWAGIRYMSPPIWMFVFVNSFIHTIMYAFYFVTAMGYRIPKPIKQTLTTMQITQFVVGVAFAFSHLFVAYQSPISTPYMYHLGDAVKSAFSSVTSDASSAIATATATASANSGAWMKKLALRAAGREGLAENVENELGQTFGVDAVHAAKDFVKREETRYRDELKWSHCLDTDGQAFAIYLNIFYLMPLTWLFAQFFITSYLKRQDGRRRSSIAEQAYIAKESLYDARKGVGRRLSEAFEDYQGVNGDLNGEPVLVDGDEIRKEIRAMANKGKGVANDAVTKGKDAANTLSEKVSEIDTERIKKEVQDDFQKAKSAATSGLEKAQDAVSPSKKTKQNAKNAANKAKEVASDVATKGKEVIDNATSDENKQKVKDTIDAASKKGGEALEDVSETAAEAKKQVQKTAKQAQEKGQQIKREAAEKEPEVEDKAWEVVGKGKKKANEVKDEAAKKAQTGTEQAKQAKDSAKEKVEKTGADVKKEADNVKSEAQSAKDNKSTDIEKKEQDKIIDQSQTVRDEDVDTKSEPKSPSRAGDSSLGASYADIAAEPVPEEEKSNTAIVGEEGKEEGSFNTNKDFKLQSNIKHDADFMSTDNSNVTSSSSSRSGEDNGVDSCISNTSNTTASRPVSSEDDVSDTAINSDPELSSSTNTTNPHQSRIPIPSSKMQSRSPSPTKRPILKDKERTSSIPAPRPSPGFTGNSDESGNGNANGIVHPRKQWHSKRRGREVGKEEGEGGENAGDGENR